MDSAMRPVIDATNPQHVSDVLIRFLNGAHESQIEMLVECLSNEHRTLQQKFSGFVIHWVKHVVQRGHKKQYDLRNEASVKFWLAVAHCFDRELPSGLAMFRRFPIV